MITNYSYILFSSLILIFFALSYFMQKSETMRFEWFKVNEYKMNFKKDLFTF